MTTASSLALGWLDRAAEPPRIGRATVRHAPGLHEQRDGERAQTEFFIRHVFAAAYGARLEALMPMLLAERDPEGGILAACGLRRAANAVLFLETYIDRPVEQAIGMRCGGATAREQIVEVGNLAVVPPFTARRFIASLTRHLLAGEAEWAVFTAVATLRNAFTRLGVPFLRLGAARLDALPEASRAAWGSYYDTTPEVLAVRVRDAARSLLTRPHE